MRTLARATSASSTRRAACTWKRRPSSVSWRLRVVRTSSFAPSSSSSATSCRLTAASEIRRERAAAENEPDSYDGHRARGGPALFRRGRRRRRHRKQSQERRGGPGRARRGRGGRRLRPSGSRRASPLKKGGAVVVNTSINGILGMPGSAAYAASKAAARSLVRVAAAELAGAGVRVRHAELAIQRRLDRTGAHRVRGRPWPPLRAGRGGRAGPWW